MKHNYLFITVWFTFETSLTDFASLLITKTDVDRIFNVFLAKSNKWVAFSLMKSLLSVNEYHLR